MPEREYEDEEYYGETGSGETGSQQQEPVAVSQTDFDAYKTTTAETIQQIQTQIKDISAASSDLTPLYILGGIVGVLAIAVACCFYRISTLSERIIKLQEKILTANDTISELGREIKIQNAQINELRMAQENLRTAALPPAPLLKNTFAPSAPAAFAPPPVPSLADKYADFVCGFNALSNSSSAYEGRKAAEDFARKFNVINFSCVNAEMRVNDPMPAPEFKTAAGGNYWAFEVEPATFAVVPKVRSYNDNIHFQQAMGEIFSSNFVSGNTYKKIRVEKPAIFNGEWKLASKGTLVLE